MGSFQEAALVRECSCCGKRSCWPGGLEVGAGGGEGGWVGGAVGTGQRGRAETGAARVLLPDDRSRWQGPTSLLGWGAKGLLGRFTEAFQGPGREAGRVW